MEKPFVLLWLTQNALVSMFPLLTRDKLIIPYIALHGLFILLYNSPGGRQHKKETHSSFGTLRLFLLSCFLVLHVVYLTIAPPRKYPFLFEAVIMLLCFSQFVVIFLYTNTKQWTPSKLSALSTEAKKHLWFLWFISWLSLLFWLWTSVAVWRGNQQTLAHFFSWICNLWPQLLY